MTVYAWCHHGYDKPGWPQHPHDATGYLCAPDGKPISPMCAEHAAPIIAEYHEKLGEQWAFVMIVDRHDR